MRKRLAPFLALLDAKYAPLLFAVAPQSYAVFLWLWLHSDRSGAAYWFAVLGAVGFEWVYVGAIAWAEEGKSSRWTWATATIALVFSCAVAIYVHLDQEGWATLHMGFPLVAFAYTINMYKATSKDRVVASSPQPKVQPDWFEMQLAPPSVALPQLTVAANAIEDDAVALSVAPELPQAKRNPLDGIDVAVQLASQFGGNKTAMANHYGVSAQAIRNRLREAN